MILSYKDLKVGKVYDLQQSLIELAPERINAYEK
jgi:hypothetical protein